MSKSLDFGLSSHFISRITTIYQYLSFLQQILVEYLLLSRYCTRCWRDHSEQSNYCLYKTWKICILVGGEGESSLSPVPPAYLAILPPRFLFLTLSRNIQDFSSIPIYFTLWPLLSFTLLSQKAQILLLNPLSAQQTLSKKLLYVVSLHLYSIFELLGISICFPIIFR